jgi:hypothetical protein
MCWAGRTRATPAARVAWLEQHFKVGRFADLPADKLEPAITALVGEVAAWARLTPDEEWADIPPVTDPGAPCTQDQRDAIEALRVALNMNPHHFRNFLQQKARVDRIESLTIAQADYVLAELTKRLDRQTTAPH